ncbi:unnamed protein product [Notodromas monacha]|uniref:E3 ubiquitin-protein ligase ZNRF2 n=1 Tax=Notodromas monacha TaxID=399045 RepID=A0A7R9BKU4_9CRUS|nr:unnamed protein product [Notodromas monacha]CAG0917336.1 unnamed protein product [Notodromas monacha]
MGAKFSSVGQNINSAGAGSADAPTVSCGEQSFSENARDSGSEEQMDLMGLDFLRRSSTAGPRRLASSLLDAENAEQSGSESEGVASGGSSLPMMGSTLMMDFPFSMRRIMLSAQSLPSGVWYIDDVHCPVCDASLPYHEIESHLTVCLSRPRWQYNGKPENWG